MSVVRTPIAVGQRFGTTLTVLEDIGLQGRHKVHFIRCLCDCGREKVMRLQPLMDGRARTCGDPGHRGKHYASKSAEYRAWIAMRSRCANQKTWEYKHYGERGIIVCAQWLNSFETFLEDMGPRPAPGYSLDRIDNNGSYCRDNCRWTSKAAQNRNRRTNRWLTYDGRTMVAADWAAELGMLRGTLINRLRSMPVAKALTQPLRQRRVKKPSRPA